MLARWSGALVLSAWLSVWGCAQAQPSEMVNAAKTGDVAAQYELGKAYLYGKGVEKNADDALRWLRLAAETQGPGQVFRTVCRTANMPRILHAGRA